MELSASISIRSREELKSTYGASLCHTLGYSTIKNIPEVTAEQFPLTEVSRMLGTTAHPRSMGAHNLVRGVDGLGSRFIAMKCDLLDETQKKITEVVALIFQYRPPHAQVAVYPRNRYETACRFEGANGEKYFTAFFNTNWREGTADIALFKRVMNGEVVNTISPTETPLYIRISAKA